jgi:hypothetical protein
VTFADGASSRVNCLHSSENYECSSNELLAKPCEFFREFFGGRTPTVEEKLFWIEGAILRMTSLQVFCNDLYLIELGHEAPFIRLSITRHDGRPCKEWKHLQHIKNELIGPEHEAVELFPAESRLLDTTNQYHMWVHSDPCYRFPIGWQTRRFVLDNPCTVANSGFGGASIQSGQSIPVNQAA